MIKGDYKPPHPEELKDELKDVLADEELEKLGKDEIESMKIMDAQDQMQEKPVKANKECPYCEGTGVKNVVVAPNSIDEELCDCVAEPDPNCDLCDGSGIMPVRTEAGWDRDVCDCCVRL